MTTNIASSITILKKFSMRKETLSYSNQTFHRVGFFGRVKRIFSFLLCKDGFKDCKSEFITKHMVQFYNKHYKTMTQNERQIILKKIKLFSHHADTQKFLKRLRRISSPIIPKINPTPSEVNSPELKDKSSESISRSSNETNTEKSKSNSSSDSCEKGNGGAEKISVDWNQILNLYKQKKITNEELVEYFKLANTSTLAPDSAVKLFTIHSKRSGINKEISEDISLFFNASQRGALIRYLLSSVTKPGSLGIVSGQKIICSLLKDNAIPNDIFHIIEDKRMEDITPEQALQVTRSLAKENLELAKMFTVNLTHNQIAEIVKAHFVDPSFLAEISLFIERDALYRLCKELCDPAYLLVLLRGFDLDPKKLDRILPSTFEQLWNDIFLGGELNKGALAAVAKKIMKSDAVSQGSKEELISNWRSDSEHNDSFVANMRQLRALGNDVHMANSKDRNKYIIPLLSVIEPKNNDK